MFTFEAFLARHFCKNAYKNLFKAEWNIIDNPENFNHMIDLYYQWSHFAIPHWLERGVYSIQAIKMFDEPIVIELCCGDGFNAKHFYSTSAKRVYSCDFDKKIIKMAKKLNKRENIEFVVADIRNGIENIFGRKVKKGEATNLIWDTAIEHFTEKEIDNIMKDIKNILADNGILSGHTIVERAEGKSLKQHEYEFKNMEDLKRFFTPYFKNVMVFETIYPERHNLYFYASDGNLPFDRQWTHCTRTEM